jgi:hypothetical protein
VFLRIKGEQPNVWITCIGDVATIRDPGRRVIGRVVMAEFFYRARASGLTEGDTFVAPISLVQLGETVGLSIASVNGPCWNSGRAAVSWSVTPRRGTDTCRLLRAVRRSVVGDAWQAQFDCYCTASG